MAELQENNIQISDKEKQTVTFFNMLSRALSVCVLVCVMSSGSPLNCRWIDQKFGESSDEALKLLEDMGLNSTTSTEDAEEMPSAFPDELYKQKSNDPTVDKVSFSVQVLNEVETLFSQNYSSTSWEEKTVDGFLGVVDRQAENLQACIQSRVHKRHNKKLHMSFKRLSHVLKQMDHSAESWELIRKQIKDHLLGVHQLIAPKTATNLSI